MKQPQLRAIRAILERMPTDGPTAVNIRQAIGSVEAHATALNALKSAPDPMLSQLAINQDRAGENGTGSLYRSRKG